MTPIFIIIGLVLNGILAHIIGNVAKDRKIGYNTAFLVSFLLSPLIGLLLVIASVPLTEAERDRLSYGSTAETAKAPQKEVQLENGLSKDNLMVIAISIVSVICLFLLAHLDLL